jgi:hypothetical protein
VLSYRPEGSNPQVGDRAPPDSLPPCTLQIRCLTFSFGEVFTISFFMFLLRLLFFFWDFPLTHVSLVYGPRRLCNVISKDFINRS